MKNLKSFVGGVLVGLVIGVGCCAVYLYHGGFHLSVKRTYTISENGIDPLIIAIDKYQSLELSKQQLLRDFEKLVITRKSQEIASGQKFDHALVDTATEGMTNHIKILLQYGGDLAEPLRWLESHNKTNAAALLQSIAQQQKQP